MTISALRDLRQRLREGRNSDGGWGYYAHKSARLEPTAWATLALAGTEGATDGGALPSWPLQESLLRERADGEPNYGFHALALLAMQACAIEHTAGNASLFVSLQHVKGVRLEHSAPNSRQDNSLQGWSWIPGTFSWVEPTAWSLLCLKKWARTPGVHVDAARLNEAERVLINRSCVAGGWNYGNPDVLGTNLRPYVPTSAIALLAMQDRRDEDVVLRSADYLQENATSERSATALALALIALRVYGRPDGRVRTALIEQLPITLALGNHAAIALAAYVLDPDQTYAAFTL
jgi:hypothetical protein